MKASTQTHRKLLLDEMKELPILHHIFYTCKVKITTYFVNIQQSVVEMQHVGVGYHNKKTNKFIYATECIKVSFKSFTEPKLQQVKYIVLLSLLITWFLSHLKIIICQSRMYLLLWALSEHISIHLNWNSCSFYRHLNLLVLSHVLEIDKPCSFYLHLCRA